MKLVRGILGVTLAVVLSGPSAWGQTPPAPVESGPKTVQTFYLSNISQPHDGDEIVNAIRNVLPPSTLVYLATSQNVIVVRATPDELNIAQKLINDLDRPKKTYRLI